MSHNELKHFSQNIIMTVFKHRTLENACQPLIPFLQEGLNVLDGGGEGPITLGMAQAVASGAVVGGDHYLLSPNSSLPTI